MAMRLLPRSEVNKAKALDRQREIDEGKKLATRVDTLRELAAQEDTNLSKFRDNMVSQIMADIKPLQEEYDGLGHKITLRKGELAQLMKPIDDLWAAVKQAQAINNDWETDLAKREVVVDVEKQANLDISLNLNKRMENLDNLAIEISKNNESSARIEANAKELLKTARAEAHALSLKADVRTNDLNTREIVVAARERDAKMVDAKNKADAKANNEEAKIIKDRYDTLQRTLKRLGK